MTRKLSTIFILSLLIFAFLAVSSFAISEKALKKAFNTKSTVGLPKAKLAGAERGFGLSSDMTEEQQSLGFDGRFVSASPGKIVGYTTYDYQHNGRMTRLVDWRGNQMVHFTWMKKVDSCLDGCSRGTAYEAYDPDEGDFLFKGSGGGCHVHSFLGDNNYSGYVGLDVGENGAVNICSHHRTSPIYAATIFYDNVAGACFFSPGTSRLPDSTQAWIQDPDDEYEYIWPAHDFQVRGSDTVSHVFAHQYKAGIQPSIIAYFRRVGGPYNPNWDYPPVIADTTMDIGQAVSSSRVSEKVALYWICGPGGTPGDYESVDRGSQRLNDLYYAISPDMGVSWGNTQGNNFDKFNVTKFDSSQAGWVLHSDLSGLIGTDDYLHVIWDAREYSPTPQPGGSYVHFYGSRLQHWSEDPAQNDEIRTITDANWDLPDQGSCHGGAWNEMSIVKMSISECEGKFYAMFVQFHDVANGITNDCHLDATTAGATSGTANGELYISVSDNGGYNWDVARNLTNSRTPGCDDDLGYECDADQWPSMSRFGMYVDPVDLVDWEFAEVVDPSSGDYTGDYYLDVFYVNDKYPGGAVQDAGVWTYNPMKWFRVKCVNPVPNPLLATSPSEIADPAWTHYSTQLDTTIRLENIGNAALSLDNVSIIEVNKGVWLEVGSYPSSISHLSPNYITLDVYLNYQGSVSAGPVRKDGYILIEWSDGIGGPANFDSFPVHLIVADTVQFPQMVDIRTDCKRLVFDNAGGMGDEGSTPDGGYNMSFFNDCDTTNNGSGTDDNASVYLYEGSPFVLRVVGGDTLLSYSMFDADWLSEDGMRPLAGIWVDSTTHLDYQYGYTGKFLTKDSTIGLEIEYFAPTHPDSCSFIVMKQKFYNNTQTTIPGVYMGDLYDWDIPSDSGVENGSGFERTVGPGSRDLMYCYGAEYSSDSIANNDCVLADQRMGGMAFYNGIKVPYVNPVTDSIENPQAAWWTHINADWISPSGGFIGSQVYRKLQSLGTAWQTWASTIPAMEDSLYQDLNMVCAFGQWDMVPGDTFIFIKILTTTYDGGLTGMQDNVDKAHAWIESRPYSIFSWPSAPDGRCCFGDIFAPSCDDITIVECLAKGDYISWDVDSTCGANECPASTECDCEPGNANGDVNTNIFDVTYMISYLYKGGPEPTPYPICSGDPNGLGCTCNIFDVTYLISYLYKGGPPPVTCEEWLAVCGPPLR